MPTSGSVDFSVSRDDLLHDALMLAGAIGPDDTAAISTAQLTHAARLLNKVVKALGARGPALWARKTGYVLPITTTNDVLLGPSGGHATLSYVRTTTSSSAPSGATSIVVDSVTGIVNGYNLGVVLADNSVFWTTVNGAPVGTTVTLATALSDSVNAGAHVYVYQTKIVRPLRVIDAFLRNQTTNVDIPIRVITKAEFDSLSYKPSSDRPNQVMYDPQLDRGLLSVYPRFSNGDNVLHIIFHRPFEDFDVAADTPDFPQEWYDYLSLQCAVRLAPTYGLPVQDRALLRQEAKEALDAVSENEPEEGSYYIQPMTR